MEQGSQVLPWEGFSRFNLSPDIPGKEYVTDKQDFYLFVLAIAIIYNTISYKYYQEVFGAPSATCKEM